MSSTHQIIPFYLSIFLLFSNYMIHLYGKQNVSIPLISISLNYDRDHFLTDLLTSIDYSVDLICIQIGNSDQSIVYSIQQSILSQKINYPTLHIEITTQTFNPGSAKGFNFGLHRMMDSNIYIPYVIILNYDIAFKPGVLKYLSEHIPNAIQSEPNVGIGFMNLCCGGEWSAIIITRKLVENIGYFDENFYPAYYEDDDYGIRTHLSNFKAIRLMKANLTHGRVDGSKKYISGVQSTLPHRKKVLNASQLAWRNAFRLGIEYSREYIKEKWNIKLAATTIQPICKSFRGINRVCKVGYKNPFGDRTKSLGYWMLNETRLNYLIAVDNGTIPIRFKL